MTWKITTQFCCSFKDVKGLEKRSYVGSTMKEKSLSNLFFPKRYTYMYVFDIVPFAVHLDDLGDGRFVGVETPFSQNISLGSGLSLYLERGRPNALRMNLGTEEARVRLPSLDTKVSLKG